MFVFSWLSSEVILFLLMSGFYKELLEMIFGSRTRTRRIRTV